MLCADVRGQGEANPNELMGHSVLSSESCCKSDYVDEHPSLSLDSAAQADRGCNLSARAGAAHNMRTGLTAGAGVMTNTACTEAK